MPDTWTVDEHGMLTFLSYEDRWKELVVYSDDVDVRRRCLRNLEEMWTGGRRKNKKTKIPDWMRREVFERDNYECKNCFDRYGISADHIIPESVGGATHPDNLQTLCKSCNSKKGTKAIKYITQEEYNG